MVTEGVYEDSGEGSAQGNTTSPILANIYMHNVLTLWYKFVVLKGTEGSKGRLIGFGRFAEGNSRRKHGKKPETFGFLGFASYCGKGRKSGNFCVKLKTSRKKYAQKLGSFLHFTQRHLCKALNRRSQKKSYTWDGFADMLKVYPLAKPKIYVRLF